jgi:tetratricopeptide (TPR) repeat protein
MKKLLVLLLCLLVTAVALLLLFPKSGAALISQNWKTDTRKSDLWTPLFNEAERTLAAGDLQQAMSLARKGMREAADSDEFYQYVVLEAKYHFQTMQADSFLQCNQRLRHYLERLSRPLSEQQKLLEVESEMQLGVYLTKIVGQMDSAQTHYFRVLDLLNTLPGNADNRMLTLLNIADNYKQQGRYDQAVSYCHQALELGDSIGMSDATRITINIGIASAYAAMGSFEQSRKWWEKAEKLKPKMQMSEMFQYLNNRGNDYYLQGHYEESLRCFLELDSLLDGQQTMEWERMYGRANLSDVYMKLGHYDQAGRLLDTTERFFTEKNQLLPLFYLTTQRIELNMRKGNLAEAQRIADSNPIPQWMIPEQVILRQKVLSSLYEKQGRWQQFALALKDYSHLHDSIASEGTKIRFSEVLMHYEHDKQLMEKQRQIEKNEIRFHLILAMLVTAIVVIVLLLIILLQKKREKSLREAEIRGSIMNLRMETVRNRITPHFISNALAAEMVAQTNGRQPDLDMLVQLLHRGIEMTDSEQSTLSEELEFIRFYCDVESRSVGPDFRLFIELGDHVDADRVVLPSMMVQILVENAIKHGLKAKKPKEGCLRWVRVKVTKLSKGTLVEVIDNGVGLSDSTQVVERTGLRVMRQTIVLLNEQNANADVCRMNYNIENYSHPDGDTGCRACLLLPDHFDYRLKKLKEGIHENNYPK